MVSNFKKREEDKYRANGNFSVITNNFIWKEKGYDPRNGNRTCRFGSIIQN